MDTLDAMTEHEETATPGVIGQSHRRDPDSALGGEDDGQPIPPRLEAGHPLPPVGEWACTEVYTGRDDSCLPPKRGGPLKGELGPEEEAT